MKRVILLSLLVFSLLLSGCPFGGEEGSSFENAVVIDAETSDVGIPAEYDWLRENGCPNNGGVTEVEMQELQENDGSFYDLLYAVCEDGTKKVYYFNIDSFFGKWAE